MMKAVLSNADHPEYGVAAIPLPVPRNQYDHCVALLEALEIGDASEADCRLDSLDSAWPVLNQLVCTSSWSSRKFPRTPAISPVPAPPRAQSCI